MNDGAAGKVDRLDSGVGIPDAVHQAGDAPDHVGQREVDDEHPGADKEHDGGELHALRNRADNQGRGDDRKSHLEHGKDVLREPVGVVRVRGGGHVLEEEKLRAPEERAGKAFAEDQTVTDRPPEDGDEAGDAEALGEDREHIFAADEPAVEKGQSRQGHEQH